MKRKFSYILFFEKVKKPLKYLFLMFLTFYSILIIVANIGYFKNNKIENKYFPKLNFGIDIVGGNQLTVSIDSSGILEEFKTGVIDTINDQRNDGKIKCNFTTSKRQIDVEIQSNDIKHFIKNLHQVVGGISFDVVDKKQQYAKLQIKITDKLYEKIVSETTDKAISILKSRIDGVGVKEIAIQRYGIDKIVILIPQGVNVERIKKVINTTAKLNFHLMDAHHIFNKKPDIILDKYVLLPSYNNEDGDLLFLTDKKPALSGDCITNAQIANNGFSIAINFKMNNYGAKKFGEITNNNIGRLLAIVLDGKVLMAPRISTAITTGSGSITGGFSQQEANDLAVLLRSGSLPAKIEIINERHLSSVFDRNILNSAFNAVGISMIFITVLMVVRYRQLGIIAMFALLLNFFYSLSTIALCGFTLTLPGIAGFVLMLGMATDANILIYEKMKELKIQGFEKPNHIIKTGFSKALATIIDSNLTTIIAGIALFSFGGSFIKGFSITLIIGIIFSIFTAVNITKMIIYEIYKNKRSVNI